MHPARPAPHPEPMDSGGRLPSMRVALVHDWLTGMRGGERVLHEHAVMFPDADLYTLVHVPGSTTPRIEDRRIFTSPLSRLPGIERHYRKLLPLFPWAIERFQLAGYDLVLSSSHAVAKGIRSGTGAIHVCYCFTPMRYVWDQADAYLGRGLKRALSEPLAARLRSWDRRTSGPDRVQRFIAISQTTSDRILGHYGRKAEVIFPPVDVDRVRPHPSGPEDFYLMVGGFVPYKRDDLVIEAFRALDRPLVVAGDGPARDRLEARASANVRFAGRVSDQELTSLYGRCRALVYPQEEDFGIVPVEAQAAGRPVIAYGSGGATETVVDLDDPAGRPPTGLFFTRQTPKAMVEAIERFEREAERFDPLAIRRHAESFSVPRFHREMQRALVRSLEAPEPPQ